MVAQVINNVDLHFEHIQWNNELLFWRDEIRSFQNRLDEVVSASTDKKFLAEIDRFQNNFFIHQEKINELIEEIRHHELSIAKFYKEIGEVMDRIYLSKHNEFKEKLEIERKIYHSIKREFFQFLSKYL